MKNPSASIKFSYPEIPIEPLFCNVWGSHDGEPPPFAQRPPISRTQVSWLLRLRVAALGFWVVLWENRNQNKWKLAVNIRKHIFCIPSTKNACKTNEKGYKPPVMIWLNIWEILAGVLADGWRSALLCHSAFRFHCKNRWSIELST